MSRFTKPACWYRDRREVESVEDGLRGIAAGAYNDSGGAQEGGQA